MVNAPQKKYAYKHIFMKDDNKSINLINLLDDKSINLLILIIIILIIINFVS